MNEVVLDGQLLTCPCDDCISETCEGCSYEGSKK